MKWLVYSMLCLASPHGAAAESPTGTPPTTPAAPPAAPIEKVPLRFPPAANQVIFGKPMLEWDLTAGHTIAFRDRLISANDFAVEAPSPINFAFKWPASSIKSGTLSFVDPNRQLLGSIPFETSQITVEGTKNSLLVETAKVNLYLINRPTVRYCLSQVIRESQHSFTLCSPLLTVARNPNLSLQFPVARVLPKILLGTAPANIKGQTEAPTNQKSFIAIFTTGASLQFSAGADPLDIRDIQVSRTGSEILISGMGRPPHPRPKNFVEPIETFVSATMGFNALPLGWNTSVGITKPEIAVLGSFDIPFTQTIKYTRLPEWSDRLFIDKKTLASSYSPDATVTIYNEKNESQIWNIKDLEKGMINVRYYSWAATTSTSGTVPTNVSGTPPPAPLTTVTSPAGKTTSAFDVYRGYSNEFSGRLYLLRTDDNKILLSGEGTANIWFEQIPKWDNYWLSRQRWGLQAKYATMLTADGASFIKSLSMAHVDLKYRFVPGLEAWNETFGAMLSYRQVNTNDLASDMMGVGVFWARSLPKGFVSWFKELPYMNGPKWVDADFIYYPIILTNGMGIGSNFAINFHGKIFWTDSTYGEAGFGLRQVHYYNLDLDIAYQAFYGTFGIGTYF